MMMLMSDEFLTERNHLTPHRLDGGGGEGGDGEGGGGDGGEGMVAQGMGEEAMAAKGMGEKAMAAKVAATRL